MSKSSTPMPLAIPNDLVAEIEEATAFVKLSKQDTMRMAMRIGLADLRAAHEIYAAIQELAEDKGVSFSAWAREQLKLKKEAEAKHGGASPRRDAPPIPFGARFESEETTDLNPRFTQDEESYEATQERLRRAASGED